MKNIFWAIAALVGLLLISTGPTKAQTVFVNGAPYTTTGPAASGVVDFMHSTADFTFTAAAGNIFVGLDNFHTNVSGSADAYFNKPGGLPNSDIGVILNSTGTPVTLSTYRTSALPTYDPTGGNYGYDSTHTNGALYNFFTGNNSGTVSLVSLIAGQSGTSGNANVYTQSVNTPAAAPGPSQWAAIAATGLVLGGLLIRKRRQAIA